MRGGVRDIDTDGATTVVSSVGCGRYPNMRRRPK